MLNLDTSSISYTPGTCVCIRVRTRTKREKEREMKVCKLIIWYFQKLITKVILYYYIQYDLNKTSEMYENLFELDKKIKFTFSDVHFVHLIYL